MKIRNLAFIFIFVLALGLFALCAEAALDPIAPPESFRNGDSDNFLRETEALTEGKMAETRADYGLSAMKLNDILQNDADYLAAYLLMSGETEKNGIETALSPIIDGIPYVSGWTYVFSKGFVSTDAEVSSNFIMKTVMNTDKKHRAFTKNYACFGLSVASVETEDGTVLCAVFLGAENMGAVTAGAGTVPVPWIKADTAAPRVSQEEPLLVRTGTKITDKMILDSLKISGESKDVLISYDRTLVNVSAAGQYSLPVTVSDVSGNKTLFYAEICVGDDSPYITSENIILPEIPAGQVWNTAFYVECGTQWGDVTVETDPVYIVSGMPLPDKVSVTVTNGFGNSVTAELPVSSEAVSYGAVKCETVESGGGLTVNTVGGSEAAAGGHVLLSAGSTAGTVYNYTVICPDGRTVLFSSGKPDLVWNPGEEGTYTVFLDIISPLGERKGSISQVAVVKSNEIVYNKPVLGFAEESGITVDGNVIKGIKADTTFASLRSSAIITGGSNAVLLSSDADTVLYTGFTFTLCDGDETCGVYTVAVSGDINCDGKVGIADFSKMRQVLLGNVELDEIMTVAGDVNGDGKVGIADFSKLRQVLLGNVEL